MSVQNFITNFNGGTRKNRFRVVCNIPGFSIPSLPGVTPDATPSAVTSAAAGQPNARGGFDDFHVLAAAMPASIITTNPIDYQGRKILYPGDRIYSADGFNVWTMTVLDDIGIDNLWKKFHEWSYLINGHDTNTGDTVGITDAQIVVEQLNLNAIGANGGVIKRATLFGCWPQSVGPIEMEMQARDQYNFFDVTICFKYVKYEDLEEGVTPDPTDPDPDVPTV